MNVLTSDEEFQDFKSTLLEKLPVTFRVNPGLIGHERVVEMLRDPKFIESHTTDPAKQQEEEQDGDEDKDKEILMGQKDHQDKKQMRSQVIDYSKLKMDCKSFYP